MSEKDSPWPLLIPIGVLLIVFLGTGVIWMLIPIAVLVCVFLGAFNEDQKLKSQRRDMFPIEREPPSTYADGPTQELKWKREKPIYERKRQKDQGINVGVLIPLFILGLVWIDSDFSLPILIPIFILGLIFVTSIIESTKGRSQVKEEIAKGDAQTVREIADRSGIPEEHVRKHIVHEKRRGEAEVWFDSSTGEISTTPIQPADKASSGCPYCGFALKPQDRFCPFCGAPIRA